MHNILLFLWPWLLAFQPCTTMCEVNIKYILIWKPHKTQVSCIIKSLIQRLLKASFLNLVCRNVNKCFQLLSRYFIAAQWLFVLRMKNACVSIVRDSCLRFIGWNRNKDWFHFSFGFLFILSVFKKIYNYIKL